MGWPGIHRNAFILFLTTIVLAIVQFCLECKKKKRRGYLLLEEEELDTCPEETANIFSIMTFWWLNKLMKLGHEKPLTMDDLWNLSKCFRSANVSNRFQSYWGQEMSKSKPSLLRACVRAFGSSFFLAAFFKIIQDIMAFVQPQLLKRLMNFINMYQANETEAYNGYVIAISMLLTANVQSLCLHRYFQMCLTTGMKTRAAIVTAIYQKSLKLSSSSRQKYTTGEIVNHMSVDAQRFNDTTSYLHILWSGPFQISLALYFLYQNLGYSIFAGVAIMVLMIPINGAFARKQQRLQKIQMNNKDTRIKLMDEVLLGVKVIKLYAWEKFFLRRILSVREKELNTLKSYGYLNAIQGFFWNCTPFLVSFATFSLYVFVGDEPLTSEKAFVALALFNLLQFPLSVFPSVITSLIETSVALNRIYYFLLAEEIDPNAVIRQKPLDYTVKAQRKAIIASIGNGTFRWSKEDRPILKNINLDVYQGELLAIVGKVGTGKSSLLAAFLGEMYKDSQTEVRVKGTVAYVCENSWILNATIRENIVFGHRFDPDFYNATIKACCLEPDLAILPGNDMCEVGERGVNLSGGQKKRLTLARAVYARADLYLLDDPLSAVDAHVGRHIMDNVFGPQGLLKDRARILVTHGIYHLPKVDKIALVAGGEITEYGAYDELTSNANTELARLVAEFGAQEQDSTTLSPKSNSPTTPGRRSPSPTRANIIEDVLLYSSGHIRRASAATINPAVKPSYVAEHSATDSRRQLIDKESVAVGEVSLDVYITYAKACSFSAVLVYLSTLVLSYICSVGSNVWLQYWSSQNKRTGTNENIGLYLGVYGAIGVVYALLIILQTILVWVFCAIRCSRILHESMLERVMRAPMSFFDTQPIGRTLNRFSKDQFTVDEVLPRSFHSYFRTLMNVISVIIVISVSTPYFLSIVIPLGILYYLTQKYYLAASRELKRLDSVSRSPVFSHFSETLGGIETIRAYRQQLRFIAENNYRVDENLKAYFPIISGNRWLALRLEFLGSLVVFSAALFCVLEVVYNGNIDSGIVGLSVSYALTVTGSLNWMVRQYCEIETNIVSVERIKQYLELDTEAPVVTDFRPPASWPDKGVIEFNHFSTRYREGLDVVLKDVTFKIQPREKIGIVGRTGSGKSSTTLSLFRIIEPVEGCIKIDGIDITKIGLYDLRRSLTIIPQDPTIFAGSLRENLDPFEQHDDAEIWDVLESVRLKEYVCQLDGKLNATMLQGGASFSLGQRQLLSLARALLRRTKILVLDEATSQIDVETDSIIQETIRREFQHCTIITIAHRINTVIDNDRIMVLEKGKVVEFDDPKTLLKNPDSFFYNLVRESGLVADSDEDSTEEVP
ncbi:multi drug resistance-associated protein MRP [Paraphysoderma sedebokerense]|nr:multi drug resistance-associated protein MRP [Paraphysoderma sedebokerense]